MAEAQVQPGGMGPMGGMPQQPSGEDKKEGVAESAPKAPGLLPTTPALPSPKGRRKRWKLIEIDGYFRARSDWFKNFHQGFLDDATLGGAPFPRALGCGGPTIGGAAAPCDNSIGGSNVRLRLEPTINIDEGTSVHIQADVLDNLILGTTPYGRNLNGVYTDTNRPPLGAFNGTQDPAEQNVNSDRASLRVKRAWAEVAVPLGVFSIGRMPNHWGMGMQHHGGGADPINGGYDYAADWGDTVDRAAFSAPIPGTPLRAMIAADWAQTGLASNQTDANFGRELQPFDLDDSDDMDGWVAVISKMDSPQEFKDAVDRGDTAFNYGVYFEYKTQDWDSDLTDFTLGGPFDAANRYSPRKLTMYNPDLWAKLGIGRVVIEAELAAQFGSADAIEPTGTIGVQIRKYGGTGRLTWKGLEGKLRLGFESGFATGDQWDSLVPGRIHIAYQNQLGSNLATDRRLEQFTMNREYKVDMILWRQLSGAVTNAAYFKPFLSYDLTKSIMLKVANISSFAMNQVATPGNSLFYGTEFNADIGYAAGGVFAGIAYGVLFPFGALAHPEDENGASYGFGEGNTNDAETSHTIQMRFVLGF